MLTSPKLMRLYTPGIHKKQKINYPQLPVKSEINKYG
jgi:hypothetical protein